MSQLMARSAKAEQILFPMKPAPPITNTRRESLTCGDLTKNLELQWLASLRFQHAFNHIAIWKEILREYTTRNPEGGHLRKSWDSPRLQL